MNLFITDKNNLDEIVFENRNKLYGAYVIRKSYDTNLLKATAYSFSLVVFLFATGYAVSLYKGGEMPAVPLIKAPSLSNTTSTIEIILDDMKTTMSLKSTDNLHYRIVRNELAQELTTPASPGLPLTSQGADQPGSGGSETGNPGTVSEGTPGIPETPATEDAPTFVTTMPSYPGGIAEMRKHIQSELNYPHQAIANGIEGKVAVSFIVGADGKIRKVKIERELGYGCDDEAIRVVSNMGEWNPGIQNGKRVDVKMILPIEFKLH